MDWEDVKEAGGCLLWILIIVGIILVFTALPGLIAVVSRWSGSL